MIFKEREREKERERGKEEKEGEGLESERERFHKGINKVLTCHQMSDLAKKSAILALKASTVVAFKSSWDNWFHIPIEETVKKWSL